MVNVTPVTGRNVSDSQLIELQNPPTIRDIVVRRAVTLEVLFVIRPVNGNKAQTLPQDDSSICEIAKRAKGIQNNRSALWVPDARDQPVEVGVDSRR